VKVGVAPSPSLDAPPLVLSLGLVATAPIRPKSAERRLDRGRPRWAAARAALAALAVWLVTALAVWLVVVVDVWLVVVLAVWLVVVVDA